MKKLLFLFLSSTALSAGAQETIQNIPGKYFLISAEAGVSFIGIGGVQLAGSSYRPTVSNGVSAWPTLQLRFMRMTPTWCYGVRTEATIWGDRDAIQYTNINAEPLGNSNDLYFASPAISIAPTLSRRILYTKKQELAIGIYAGVTFSPHEQDGSTGSNGARDSYLPSTTGFQLGGEIQYRYWVRPRLAVSAATGFQRNWMRYNDNADFGFNLNTIPVTAGISLRL